MRADSGSNTPVLLPSSFITACIIYGDHKPMMKSRKKAGKKKMHRLGAKRKCVAKGKKMFKIGRNHRNVRVTAVQVEPDMTLQERTLSKIWITNMMKLGTSMLPQVAVDLF